MITVHLPDDLAAAFGFQNPLQLPAAPTLGDLLTSLDRTYPGLGSRLTSADGAIRPHLNIFLPQALARGEDGPRLPLSDGEDVWVIRAVSGGGDRARPAS